MKTLQTIAASLAISTILTACSNDNQATPVNEEELITTLTAIFTPAGGGASITLEYKDLDGDGPNEPVKSVSGPFAQNTIYTGVVSFKNESVSPTENLTAEIVAEAEDHQIFYQKTGTLNEFVYATNADNFDANGNPIGLQTVFSTTAAAAGTLTISLIHLPNKSAVGVANGDPSNAGGSTDATAQFSVVVE